MNKQGTKENPKGGIEWTHIFGPGTGFTVNPVRGCTHDCKWEMPDGKIVGCYAKGQIERLHGPGIFEQIKFHPEVFVGIKARTEPAGIFIDSMADLFGAGVPTDHINQVLEVMRACPQHVFFTLTKNPTRLTKFKFPNNVMVGISAPPSFMFGKKLSDDQQQAWFRKGMESLAACEARNVWVSIEPLAVDITKHLRRHESRLSWAVVGAGSNGSKLYQPDERLLRYTLAALNCPVFFKGNLDETLAGRVAGHWREEFPLLTRFAQ